MGPRKNGMRQRKLKLTPHALRDLRDIYDYIARVNPVGAKRLIDQISVKMNWLAKSGLTGVPRDFIPGLRAFAYRDRCIFFMVDDFDITILRILHGRQDISPDDFPESDMT
jgi:toxin ParE1/3/4